jgi:hypothetical protein
MLHFANPLGFLALLAIPAILAIHFLQRESRRVQTSTLFLLEKLAPESAAGRRFERLRNSVPLWLQLLAVLLLTWVLVQPRFLTRGSAHRVVVVLDSSVSMLPFRDAMLRQLDEQTASLSRAAATTEWQLLESDPARPKLYSGTDRAALLHAAAQWQPHLGTHHFAPAVELAQMLLRGAGTLLFVSDRATPLPEGVRLLAVGRPLENCGFTGVTFDGDEWRVLVRNYGRTAQRRTWRIAARGEQSPPQELALEPGQSLALTGKIPEGADACELLLDADEFPLDDRLPLVRPAAKRLTISTADSPFSEFLAQFTRSIEAVEHGTTNPDVWLTTTEADPPQLPNTTAIVFVHDPTPTGKLLPGNIVAVHHPLNPEANWSGLLVQETEHLTPAPNEQTLLWQGERPLIFLREHGSTIQLVVNFDLAASNAARLPAFVLLLHRFVEQVRSSKIAPETRNVQTNQLLHVAGDPEHSRRAPAAPEFFEIRHQEQLLLRGAAHFADAREADFRDATTIDSSSDESTARLIEQNSAGDALAPLWTLLLAAALVTSWSWRRA